MHVLESVLKSHAWLKWHMYAVPTRCVQWLHCMVTLTFDLYLLTFTSFLGHIHNYRQTDRQTEALHTYFHKISTTIKCKTLITDSYISVSLQSDNMYLVNQYIFIYIIWVSCFKTIFSCWVYINCLLFRFPVNCW